MFGHEMAHKLTWYPCDGMIANLIDYAIVIGRLVGSIQDTRIYRSIVVEVKSKDRHLVVSMVNLKLKFRKGFFLLGSYDVDRLQDEKLRETFQEQLNTKLEILKFDNVEDGWNNFRKKKLWSGWWCLREESKDHSWEFQWRIFMFNRAEGGLVKKIISVILKRNLKKVEKALKYELRRCEVEAMNKI